MTASELRSVINGWSDKYGIEWKPPSQFEVDHETYANVIQSILNIKYAAGLFNSFDGIRGCEIFTGTNNGIMFKGIELILKDYKE